MNEVNHQPFFNKLSNNLKLFERYIAKILSEVMSKAEWLVKIIIELAVVPTEQHHTEWWMVLRMTNYDGCDPPILQIFSFDPNLDQSSLSIQANGIVASYKVSVISLDQNQ